MARFWTADLHFGHANIIRYSHRPFADVDEMHRGLVERWNAVVDPTDEVWVLGDVAMGTIAESLPHVRELHGTKVLVAGNHDRCWSGRGDGWQDWIDRYRDAGFAEIHQDVVSTQVGGHDVICCHFPYEGDSHDEDRFVPHRPVDTGQWLLHGHVHEGWQVNGRQINVGVDVWDWAPVPEAALVAIIEGR